MLYPTFPLSSLQKRRTYVTPNRLNEKRPRMNEQIRAAEVLLVGDEGAEKVSLEEALTRARAAELDLIEVSPKTNPPVVKIADFGRYLYQLQKKEKKQRSHSKQTETKTLRFGFRTDKHDLERLMDRAREFFLERHWVKFVVRLRGRELSNKDYAKDKLQGILVQLQDVAEVDGGIKKQGNQFFALLRPKR